MKDKVIGKFAGLDNARIATVKLNVELEEYYVELAVEGRVNFESTYFTDDKQDAIGTAKVMVK